MSGSRPGRLLGLVQAAVKEINAQIGPQIGDAAKDFRVVVLPRGGFGRSGPQVTLAGMKVWDEADYLGALDLGEVQGEIEQGIKSVLWTLSRITNLSGWTRGPGEEERLAEILKQCYVIRKVWSDLGRQKCVIQGEPHFQQEKVPFPLAAPISGLCGLLDREEINEIVGPEEE